MNIKSKTEYNIVFHGIPLVPYSLSAIILNDLSRINIITFLNHERKQNLVN